MLPVASFDYAILRVVPRVEREEFLNAGVLLFCRTQRFLGVRIALDEARLKAVFPALDLDELRRHLEFVEQVVTGDASGGPMSALEQAARFHWLVAPRSTVVQFSPVHTGLCSDPARALHQLMQAMVLPPI